LSGRRALSASAGTVDRFWLVIHARQQASTFWQVGRSEIVEVPAVPDAAWPVFSLDDDDLRIAVPKPCRNAQARSLLRRQSGQVTRVINASECGRIYGRPVASVPTD